MNTTNINMPPIPHPGKILQEKLIELGMSVKEFAIRANRTEQIILDVITGGSSITPSLAVAIEFVTGMDATVLLRWQSDYDEQKARAQFAQNNATPETQWMDKLPVEEMLRNRWIADSDFQTEILKFFGVVSFQAWENYYFNQKLKVAFRISLESTINPYALSAWLRRGEIQSISNYLETPYAPKALKGLMPSISTILSYPQDSILSDIAELLASVGVKIIYTEPLTGVPIKGATRWMHGHPCIQLLNKTESYENFSYTVLHELGHILLHGKKDIFIEEAGYRTDDPSYTKKEQEADDFARKWISAGYET